MEGANDFAMMKEIVTRHFSRLLEEKEPLPDLMIVDGGKGQLSSAIDALVGCAVLRFPSSDLPSGTRRYSFPAAAIPWFSTGTGAPSNCCRPSGTSRTGFAVTYHRALRLRTIRTSILDEIPCIGDVRKQALLKEFGSVARLRRVSPEEIARRVEGIGLETARAIADYLEKHPSTGGMDVQ